MATIVKPIMPDYDPPALKREQAKRRGVSIRTVYNWREAGCPGFRDDGTIEDDAAVDAWLASEKEKRGGATRGIEAERDQKIRKLKIANDKTEGRLIERADIIARFQLAAGERAAFRAKSEQEHAQRFAAAAGDVARCREILRGIWDEICAIELACSDHFAEPKK